ncbi:hypothetical protein [Anaerosolibacter sp.]|uniref:hypothetical protein n=1 Tax=Anaerosolibacter sp. TaxID=1872527 RepID=UPI0039EFF53A
MNNRKLQSAMYTIGMTLVAIVASMNVLNYPVPKIFSYFLLLITGMHFFFLFTGKYNET